MAYEVDPGGQFASDAHRRVLGVVPAPGDKPKTFSELMAKLDSDPHVPLGTTQEQAVQDVLGELQADGEIVKGKDDRYKMTKQGHTNLTAPPKEET